MKDFDNKLKNYLTVYKIPIAPDSLDPTVFYFPETGEAPKLLPAIHAQITNDIEMFTSGQPSRVTEYVIAGQVLEPGSNNKTCDINVYIILNPNLLDVDVDGLLAEEILKLADSLSGKLAGKSLHKIKYIPSIRQIENTLDKYDAVYNVRLQSWLKTPKGLK